MTRSILLLSLLVLWGCQEHEMQPSSSLHASFPGRDPRLRWDSGGNLHVIYVEEGPKGAAVLYRRLGAQPAGPFAVSPPGTVTTAGTETPPALEVLPDGTLVAGYPVALPGHWKSEIRVQRSTDHGATWSAPRLIHPQRSGSHSFLSSAVTSTGTAAFAWLDNRARHMGIYAASTRDGETFSPNRTVDAETCQCCGTELFPGRGGELWLGYRDLEPDNLRDFRVLRSRSDPPEFKEGAKLSEDGWKIDGCPETGARFAQAPDGTLWAAWFTAGGVPGVYVTSSRDGGASFATRTLLSDPGHLGRHPEIGALSDGRIVVLYETVGEGGTRPLVARIHAAADAWGPPFPVASEGGYPRFASSQDRTAVAFTRRSEDRTSVEVTDWPVLEAGGSTSGK